MHKITKAIIVFLLVLVCFVSCTDQGPRLSNITFTNDNMLMTYGYDYHWFSSGSNRDPRLEMTFPTPASLGGATSYVLQYAAGPAPAPDDWADFEYGMENRKCEVGADMDNISLESTQLDPGFYRLKINGGTYDGLYSMTLNLSELTDYTGFTGHSERFRNKVGEESIFSMTAEDLEEFDSRPEVIPEYQWFRVDPEDQSDFDPIEGATSGSYTATSADVGKMLMVRAYHGTAFFSIQSNETILE